MSSLTSSVLVAGSVLAIAGGQVFAGEEGDVGFRLIDGTLTTVLASDEDGDTEGAFLNDGQRVFAADLNGAGFADEPGFYINSFSDIADGLFLGYRNIGPLLRWDASSQTFVDAGTTLTQINGPFTQDTPTTDVVEEGFRFAYTGGEFDEHPDLQLNDISTSGAFLWNLEFFLAADMTTSDVVQETQNVFVVLNFGLDEASFDEAFEAAEAIIPTPASGVVLGLAGLMAVRRRR
ncbi:MAG: hypothetical protein AAF235_05300 [Planctomycetota bacterium]